MSSFDDPRRPRRLCRDTERGVMLGVCAGIAGHFDWSPGLTRIGALAIGWIFPTCAVIAYLIAAVIMPPRPLHYSGSSDECSFWRHHQQRS